MAQPVTAAALQEADRLSHLHPFTSAAEHAESDVDEIVSMFACGLERRTDELCPG